MLDPLLKDSLSLEITTNSVATDCRCSHHFDRARRIIPIIVSIPVPRARADEKRLIQPQSNNSAVELKKIISTFCIFACVLIDEKLLKNESCLVISCILKNNENKILSYAMIDDD